MKKLISLVLIALLCLGLLASCGNPGLDQAVERLNSVMVTMPENTGADYEVYGKLSINNVEYTITWTVADAEGNAIDSITIGEMNEDGLVTINVPEDAEDDIPYVLTATIKAPNGATKTLSFNRKVPKFVELTWSQFQSTADDAPVVIKGIVSGIVNTDTKHEIYLQDNDGGYYVYNIDAKHLEGLAVGMEIRVRGVKDTYYGVHQVVNASLEILNSTPAPVAPLDITEAFKAAASTQDKGLTNKYQSMLVTIKGATILGQVSGDSTYYDFLVMYTNAKGEVVTKQAYLRVSTSANMMDEATTSAFKDAFKDAVTKDADVTGIVSVYNNALYLIPVGSDAVDNATVKDRTDAEKIDFEKLLMDSVPAITRPGEITLATAGKAYNTVAITWALEANDDATLTGNKISVSVLPTEQKTVKLTATLKVGEATGTREFTLVVSAAPKKAPLPVEAPAATTAYKFMMMQNKLNQNLYWNGRLDGAKLAVTTDPAAAVDVYLEAATGGYYLYIGSGEAKQYLVVTDVGGTATPSLVRARNFNAETANVYVYDATVGALCTTLDLTKDDETTTKTMWFGSYNKNDTIGLSEIKYINAENAGVSQFPARFVTIIDVNTAADKVTAEKGTLSVNTNVAVAGTVTLPVSGTIYGDVAIAWEVATSDYATLAGNVLTYKLPTTDTATVTLTATLTSGTESQTKEFTITLVAPPQLTPEEILNALYALQDGASETGLYTLTGVITELDSFKNPTIVVTGFDSKPVYCYRLTDSRFVVGATITVTATQIKNYSGKYEFMNCTLDEVILPEGTDPTPDPEPEEPETVTPLADGVKVVIAAPAFNKLLSMTKTGYYNVGIDYTGTDYSVAGDDEIFVVALNDDGSYTFTSLSGKVIALADSNASLSDTGANTKWVLEAIDGQSGVYLVKNVVKGNYLEWYNKYSNWSTYASSSAATDNQFHIAFYIVDDTTSGGGDVVDPTPDPEPEEPTTTTIADIIAAGSGNHEVSGTVVGANDKSFLLKDSTGYILVYLGSTPSVAVGDIVTVAGPVSAYNQTVQFGAGTTATKTGSETVTHPTATIVDGAALDAFVAPIAPQYVEVTGVLIVSGNYFNLEVDGASKNQGSLTYLNGTLKTTATALANKVVVVKGYTTGISSGKYVNLMVTDVTEATISDAEKVALEKDNLNVTLNDNTATLPTTGSAYTDVQIAWEILTDESNVATLEGGVLTVTPISTNTSVTLKATITLGTVEETKEIEITVTALVEGLETATLVATDFGVSNGEAVATKTFGTDNAITIEFVQGSASNPAKYYTSGSAVRVYAGAGSNVVISCASGYNIKSITFTAPSAEYAFEAASDTLTNGTAAVNGTTTVITANDGATSVTLTNGGGQFRFTSVVVEYAPVA